ncbi:hypothetical protein LO763_20125 [Glycomyces sp. A-F 0318]|uniref:hypothetical protein n=1 Tax=Glycomyces amatae TaxID=2881355 RepID=UPI001E29FBF5|nr:hypothetical protein [Glycomyces amatae]MCD0445922.1 hypothetical protein [Glycomyces amatae]
MTGARVTIAPGDHMRLADAARRIVLPHSQPRGALERNQAAATAVYAATGDERVSDLLDR